MTHVQDEIRETPCRKDPLPIGTVQTLSARCLIFLRPVLCDPPRRFLPSPLARGKYITVFPPIFKRCPANAAAAAAHGRGEGKGPSRGDYRGV